MRTRTFLVGPGDRAACCWSRCGRHGRRDDVKKFSITGVNYTKWLWGTPAFRRLASTTSPTSRVRATATTARAPSSSCWCRPSRRRRSRSSGRMKARFNQNFWTNFGGFGGGGVGDPGSGDCLGGDCGEFDSRSAQYVKFRGLTINITPGYKWVDTVTIGSSDFGMFDPFTIGKIRYIDRDNGSGLIFQGGVENRKFTYDFARDLAAAAVGGPELRHRRLQRPGRGLRAAARSSTRRFEVRLRADLRVRQRHRDRRRTTFNCRRRPRHHRRRFEQQDLRPALRVPPRARPSTSRHVLQLDVGPTRIPDFARPASFFGISGFSPVPAGKHDDEAYTLDLDVNDPFGNGLSFNLQYFDIGAEYVSVMAARRESDVLLTEGHDGACGLPGPDNCCVRRLRRH